jgi:hypothetical protein
MSYGFNYYPNPTSISPYRPGYQDYFTNQQYGSGSVSSYGFKAYTGRGNLSFSARSSIPTSSAFVDKFEPLMQFTGRSMYNTVASYLLNRRLDLPQGLPLNLYAANQNSLYQLGSQQYNIINPALLYSAQPQQAYYPAYSPMMSAPRYF